MHMGSLFKFLNLTHFAINNKIEKEGKTGHGDENKIILKVSTTEFMVANFKKATNPGLKSSQQETITFKFVYPISC